jgi:TorA maturation chaperone TorD
MTGEASAVERALGRSALYEALALGFAPPERETVRRLAGRRHAAGLVVAAAIVSETLAPLVERLAATDAALATLAASHRRLFGHTARGEVPLYETEYGAGGLFVQPQELADVGGFYAAFGLLLAPGGGERADHVRCECEFMMFLARKEAFALERGDAATVDGVRHAARLFLRDHLGRFAPALGARLARRDPGGVYGALECERAGVAAGSPALRLSVPVEDTTPMACGACPLGTPGTEGDGA